MKVSEPGIFFDMADADYRKDPCPSPSLTQSLAKILIEKSPLHCWHACPSLNPDHRPSDDSKFDLGNVAHKLLIGRGRDIELVEYLDWRTKAAQLARDTSIEKGKLPVLGKQYSRADKMVRAAREQLEMRGLGRFFTEGNGEAVTVWREGSIWLRQMIDWLSPDCCEFVDYKTLEASVAPQNIDRLMVNWGWSIQAAMAERGLDALDPKNAGRRKFYFVVQETEVPYQLTVVELTRAPMTLGGKQLDRAIEIWRQCMTNNVWPGYPLDIVQPQWPAWAEAGWLSRELEYEDRKSPSTQPDHIMAG